MISLVHRMARRSLALTVPLALISLIALLGAPAAWALERLTGDGEHVDFVIEIESGTATLYLARKPTNEPLRDVKPQFVPERGNEGKLTFKPTSEPGVYTSPVDAAELPEGRLVVTVDGHREAVAPHCEHEGHGTHDAEGSHEGHDHAREESGHEGHDHGGHEGHSDHESAFTHLWEMYGPQALLLAIGLGLGISFPTLRRRFIDWRAARRAARLLACLAVGGWLAAAPRAIAGDGHNHGDVEIGGPGKGSVDVVITKKSQFLIGVRTVPAVASDVADALQTFGHVGPKPNLDSNVRSPIPGFLRGVTTIPWGSKVKRGQVLATVDGISAMSVRSPVDGVLIEASAVEGSRVDAGTPLFRVVDMSSLWVDAEVFQKDLPLLQNARGVSITVEGDYPAMRGTMSGARTMVDAATLSAKVYVEIQNPPENLPLGVVAQVAFELPGKSVSGFVLPKSALLDRGGERLVFIQTGPETFAPRPVQSSAGTQHGTIVVTRGLSAGDRVVVAGNYQLLVGAK